MKGAHPSPLQTSSLTQFWIAGVHFGFTKRMLDASIWIVSLTVVSTTVSAPRPYGAWCPTDASNSAVWQVSGNGIRPTPSTSSPGFGHPGMTIDTAKVPGNRTSYPRTRWRSFCKRSSQAAVRKRGYGRFLPQADYLAGLSLSWLEVGTGGIVGRKQGASFRRSWSAQMSKMVLHGSSFLS